MYRFIFFYSLNQVGGIILEISVYFGKTIDRNERNVVVERIKIDFA